MVWAKGRCLVGVMAAVRLIQVAALVGRLWRSGLIQAPALVGWLCSGINMLDISRLAGHALGYYHVL